MKRQRIEIKTASDYELICCDMLDEFIQSMLDNNQGYTRNPNEDDFDDFGHCDISYMFTQKGMNLIDRYIKRMKRLGEKHFPDSHISISSGLCIFP